MKAQTGANVVLMQLQGSGMSHFFYVGFSDYEKMELVKTRKLCSEFEFIQTIGANSHSDLYFNRIGELSQRGDWTKDSIFFKYDLYVEAPKAAEYAQAWSKMTNAIGGPDLQAQLRISLVMVMRHTCFCCASSLSELTSETKEALLVKLLLNFHKLSAATEKCKMS